VIALADSPLVGALHPSPNHEPRAAGLRPSILLLHYTGVETAAKAIDWLARPESRVSCHYVIDEHGFVTQMVAEGRRAWHAGVSHWGGIDDVNSASIGIEIQNPGHAAGYPPFPDRQMRAVLALGLDIARRHAIPPERVLAHSDVAPGRKIDPGERFDWAYLAANGLGHWLEPAPLEGEGGAPADTPGGIGHVQAMLHRYGYGIAPTGEHDARSRIVVAAFQRHFRPARVDGEIDASTRDTLARLLAALDATRIG
jgi:N-acetylmuramoyl-L-alanine amidase